jgi:two-component system response regulator NreC
MQDFKQSICVLAKHELDRVAYRSFLQRELNASFVVTSNFVATNLWGAIRNEPALLIAHADGNADEMSTAVSMVRRLHPSTKIVILAETLLPAFVSCLEKGEIHGYALLSTSASRLVEGLRIVLAGGTYIDEAVQHQLEQGGGLRAPGVLPLSPREAELLPLLAKGMTLREAAEAMAISYKTADSYRSNLFRKLGVHDRLELARYAIREKIISL